MKKMDVRPNPLLCLDLTSTELPSPCSMHCRSDETTDAMGFAESAGGIVEFDVRADLKTDS